MSVRLFPMPAIVAALTVGSMVVAAAVAVAQDTASGTGQATVGGAKPSAPPVGVDFKPGFDDLMTMLVQPRHIKLYYAGSAANWELAAAESRDLRAALKRISDTLPVYQGNDVDAAMTSIILPKIKAVDDAVAAADARRFASAYEDLTAGCTACHTYLEHPFLVIKVPDPATREAYPDQDFRAAP